MRRGALRHGDACDQRGVRAHLGRAGRPAPEADFWPMLIARCKQVHPDFLFMAEVYWDMEWTLQQQGFDLCYDKRLYDRLVQDPPDSVRGHLRGRRRLPAAPDPIHREPRRTPGGAYLEPARRARCRGRDVHATRGAPVPRRPTGRVPDAPPNTARTRAGPAIRPGPAHLLPAAAPCHRRCPSGVRGLAPMRLHGLLRGSTPPARRVVLVEPAGALSGRGQPLARRCRGPGATAVARSRRTDLRLRRPV